jgi:hypothetical protein
MATVEPFTDVGTLANNFMFVNGLRSALSKTETNVSAVVKSFRVVIGGKCWRHWIDPNGKEVEWNAADFRDFVESPWPVGCGVSISLVIKILQGTDVLDAFLDAIRGERGAPAGNQHNAEGRNQWTNRDTITVSPDSPSTIPLPPDAPRPRVRDYAREAPTGTSVSYTMRRLERQAPDLHSKVIAGDMSPYAAAVQAGHQKRKITIPLDPASAARILVKHLQPEQVKVLIIALSHAAGFKIEHD